MGGDETISVKKCGENEIDHVYTILDECTKRLMDKGFTHWNGAHTRNKVQDRVKNDEVYLFYCEGIPVATVTLSRIAPWYYTNEDKKKRENGEADAMHMSGLATLPSHHRKGIASKALKFIENTTKKYGIDYIRFDAVEHNSELTEFYKKNGYNIVDTRWTGRVRSHFFEKKV